MSSQTFTLSLPAGFTLPDEPPLQVAAEIFLPEKVGGTPVALICLAGGGMNRRYFDLQADDDSFSFAAQMTRRGFIVIALDHLGIGQSSRPADGYALTPALVARANATASAEILARLREGRLDAGLAALPDLVSIGVGHSMGAMLTVLQQAQDAQNAGLVLLGFSTRGLPKFLPADVLDLASDPEQLRTRLVDAARRMFVQPYPVIRSSGGDSTLFGSTTADPRGVAALKQAADVLLPVPAFQAILPGNVAREAAQIRVPIFLGVGERDMVGPPASAPAAFAASASVQLEVLAETGHSHFLFPARAALFDRIATWVRNAVLSSPTATPNI